MDKVFVEGEGGCDILLSHHHETDAIDQADFPGFEPV